MRRRYLLMLLLMGLTACQDPHVPFASGRFDRVWLDFPQGDVRQVVLWLMPGYSRTGTDRGMARALADEGALVISVSTPALLAHMAGEDGDCLLPAGDLENLAHEVQARVGLERYLPPWVAGRGTGAALDYAVLAQAPPDSGRNRFGCGMLGHVLHHEKAMPQHPRLDHDAARHRPSFRRLGLAPADGISP